MFKALQYDAGRTKELAVVDAQSISKGDALQFDGGEAKRAESDTHNVRFVALESVDTADSDTILAIQTYGVEFEADCQNATNQDQVGVSNALQDEGKVNNDSTENGNAFVVTEIVGETGENGDKKVRGYFLDRVDT